MDLMCLYPHSQLWPRNKECSPPGWAPSVYGNFQQRLELYSKYCTSRQATLNTKRILNLESLKKREHIQCKIVLIHYDSEKMAWSHEKECNRNCSFLKLAPVSL